MSWTKIITISTNAAQAKGFDLTIYPQVLLMSFAFNEVNRGVFCTPSEFFRVSPRHYNLSDFRCNGICSRQFLWVKNLAYAADPIRALERNRGFEPPRPAWKAGMLAVEHQFRRLCGYREDTHGGEDKNLKKGEKFL